MQPAASAVRASLAPQEGRDVQQLRIHGPGVVRLDEVPEPEPGPRDAVLRVRACGVCGSDLGYIEVGGVAGPGPDPVPGGRRGAASSPR
jgi:NADPH:quinone reductase-like Zn-dependent oxidoreductase